MVSWRKHQSQNRPLIFRAANPDKGIKAGSYLKSTYDSHGNEIKYNCTWVSGIPTKTTYANDAVTTYGYNNSIKSRLTSVVHEGTQVNKQSGDGSMIDTGKP